MNSTALAGACTAVSDDALATPVSDIADVQHRWLSNGLATAFAPRHSTWT